MYKLICFLSFVFLLISLSSIEIFAQPNKFVGGVFINGNGIHIIGDDEIFWQSSNGTIWGAGGLSGGVSVKRNINKTFYLNLEIRYIQKGSIYEYSSQPTVKNQELLRLNYFEIPVLLGYNLRINKKSYMFETGFGIAKMFSSKLKLEEFANRNYNPDAKRFKENDISWIGSVKFPLNRRGKENLLFGLRCSYSIFSIHENYTLRNLVYGIQLDYLFTK
jgi:hypothetical protein